MNNTRKNKKERPVKGRSMRWVPAIFGLLVAGYLFSTSEHINTLFQRFFTEASVNEMLTSIETLIY